MTNETQPNPDQYEFYEIALLEEVPNGERLYIQLDDKPIIIFNINGEFYAIDDECTHDNGPLGDGELRGHHVTCPRHGAIFDVKTGRVLSLPAVKNVNTYPIRVNGDKLEIGVKIDS